MIFVFITIGFFVVLFFASLFIIRALSRVKLKTKLKHTNQSIQDDSYISTLTKLVKNDPGDTDTRLKLVRALMEMNKFSEAIIHLNNILNHDTHIEPLMKKEIRILLAQNYQFAGNLDEAYKIYLTLRQINPNDPVVYVHLAHVDVKRGNKQRAIKWLSKAVSIDPQDINTIKELGLLLYESGSFPEAFSMFKKVIVAQPDDPEVNYYLGKLYINMNKLKRAYAHFLKARVDQRFEIESLFNLANILKNFNKLDESLKVFSTILKNPDIKHDTMLEIRYELAELYLAKKNLQKAILQWEKILAHVSDYRDVREKLERYEQTKTNRLLRNYLMSSRSEFIELCKKIINVFTKNVVIIRTLVHPDSSIEIFTQAVYHNVATTIYFKFFRGNSDVGQFAMRDFYERMKELKAKLGVCFTTGNYTDEALAYSKGRILELYGREQLVSLLSKITTS